ncbi:MAG: helicase C-terminal domain-containing protein [Pseudomonas sp.]|uniref:helicase C-terminal domain-containing protein n=1 Tax=Pseudomonas sp. TaxID=306 RepID=UPI003397A6E5
MSYPVAVRTLCEFTAKCGDLDLRFTPSPTAQEGIAGHQVVTARRGGGYQKEVSLSGDYQQLQVRGRADGFAPSLNQLEEIKTYRGDLSRVPDNHRQLHWAQAKVYGWLLCAQRGFTELRVALVYFEVASQRETLLVELYRAETLRAFFEQQCQVFLAWARQELAHRQRRDQHLAGLAFPHGAFRVGQRALAEAAYKAVSTGSCLLAQAPTGIGKTIGTLFPLLKAAPRQGLDKIFFLSAKTSGRALALQALTALGARPGQGQLRTLELVARDKACEHPDKACHGDACPLARGFYDRLPAARQAALAIAFLDQAQLRDVARAHQVCPYYLGQELARWCDVLVGDYNYFFDGSALLFGLTQANQWQVAVLVDEAHNLIERARGMYTAELDQATLRQVRRVAPATLKKALDRLNRAWNELLREQVAAYQALPQPPARFVSALQLLIAAVGEQLNELALHLEPVLQRFYFDALHFCRLVESFGDHSLFDISLPTSTPSTASRTARSSSLCVRNIVPAPFLEPRFAATRSTLLFSATLNPQRLYRDLLGLPARTAWIEVQSPFQAQQLAVRLVGHISTRYRDRPRSVAPIAALIARQYQQQPGNYLAFFSSFEYLQQVQQQLQAQHPQVPLWAQERGMGEGEREGFLRRFRADGQGLGLAVLGGAFAEGIDLPGRRLIGAFIATLGLPQLNPVNEQIQQRIQRRFGRGYAYTYLYPGLQKVVQAAGRVIRGESDRGVVYLIDDRFTHHEVRQLLPGWWRPTVEMSPQPPTPDCLPSAQRLL